MILSFIVQIINNDMRSARSKRTNSRWILSNPQLHGGPAAFGLQWKQILRSKTNHMTKNRSTHGDRAVHVSKAISTRLPSTEMDMIWEDLKEKLNDSISITMTGAIVRDSKKLNCHITSLDNRHEFKCFIFTKITPIENMLHAMLTNWKVNWKYFNCYRYITCNSFHAHDPSKIGISHTIEHLHRETSNTLDLFFKTDILSPYRTWKIRFASAFDTFWNVYMVNRFESAV